MEITSGAPQIGPSPESSAALDAQIERKISTDNALKKSTQKRQGLPPPPPVVLNDANARGDVLNLTA